MGDVVWCSGLGPRWPATVKAIGFDGTEVSHFRGWEVDFRPLKVVFPTVFFFFFGGGMPKTVSQFSVEYWCFFLKIIFGYAPKKIDFF